MRRVLPPIFALLSASPLLAQESSQEEMIERWQRQLDLGTTRGFEEIVIDEEEPTREVAGEGSAAVAPTEGRGTAQPAYIDLPSAVDVDLRIGFAFDSASILSGEVPKLERLCAAMRASSVPQFRIYGHTDATGSDDYNQRLSQLRAEEVRRWLTGTCGLAAETLEAFGLGERVPVEGSDPAAADNRRVEIQALS